MLTMVPLVLVLVPVVVAVVVTETSVTTDYGEIYWKNHHSKSCELIHHSFSLIIIFCFFLLAVIIQA